MGLTIGVDATCWANARGYGRFTRELLPRMVRQAPADRFIFFLDTRAANEFTFNAPNLETVVVAQGTSPTEAAGADSRRSIVDMLRLTRAVRRVRPKVFFSPSVYSYFPLWPGQAAVITIHDTIAERFPALTFAQPRARRFWNAKVSIAIRQARLILTVSEHAAREIADHFDISRSRIRVAGEAPAEAYRVDVAADTAVVAARAAGVPAGHAWFVYVGGFNPHKHVDLVVRAHAAIARGRSRPPHLLLVGERSRDVFHGAQATIEAAVAECGTGDLVHWTGFLPDAELRTLLAGATASLLVSAMEGYGLPAVEAASVGTPVIATVQSPLPELLAGGGRFVPPGSVDAIAEAMEELLDVPGLRPALGDAARVQARRLTWEAAADRTLEALREAAA